MSTSPEPQGSHFWHMSLMARNAMGFAIEERAGHWTPPAGISRFDAFNELRRQVAERTPALADAVVISFDIQPNHLEASR